MFASSDRPKDQEKLVMLGPVLMPHGSYTDNCSETADNSLPVSVSLSIQRVDVITDIPRPLPIRLKQKF
jgi:hypothetical protein